MASVSFGGVGAAAVLSAAVHAMASAAFMCQEIDGPSSQHESSGLPHSRQDHPRSTPSAHIGDLASVPETVIPYLRQDLRKPLPLLVVQPADA
jgi:hypothetical protein